MIEYKQAWEDLEKWVEKEREDMLTNPDRTDWFESGIACQTAYIKGKMDELKQNYFNSNVK